MTEFIRVESSRTREEKWKIRIAEQGDIDEEIRSLEARVVQLRSNS